MSAITPTPEREYTFRGYVRTWTESFVRKGEPMRVVCWGKGVPPVMLLARDDLAHYLRELFYEQFREANMTMVFHYNQYCELQSVDVLDDSESIVVKTVRPGEDWRPFIREVKEDGGHG